MHNLRMKTEEEKAAMVAKSQLARAAKNAARKSSKLRRDFLDADHWLELASARGLRLAPWGEPATVSSLRSWVRKLGLSQAAYEETLGCKLAGYLEWNAGWPLRAMSGIALEYVEEAQP